jgi:hypothetical protein
MLRATLGTALHDRSRLVACHVSLAFRKACHHVRHECIQNHGWQCSGADVDRLNTHNCVGQPDALPSDRNAHEVKEADEGRQQYILQAS